MIIRLRNTTKEEMFEEMCEMKGMRASSYYWALWDREADLTFDPWEEHLAVEKEDYEVDWRKH
jgi:hypothetical protein